MPSTSDLLPAWREKPCREWVGARNSKGYGQRKVAQKQNGVHRLTWIEANGPVAPGLQVCHHCDNPPCYEITHLFLGTHADNMADKVAKNRQARGDALGNKPCPGEANGSAKLTEVQMSAIRSEYAAGGVLQRELAVRYGISQTQVSRIVRGRSWAHAIDVGAITPVG